MGQGTYVRIIYNSVEFQEINGLKTNFWRASEGSLYLKHLKRPHVRSLVSACCTSKSWYGLSSRKWGHWGCTLDPSSFSLLPEAMKKAALLSHVSLPWYSTDPQTQGQVITKWHLWSCEPEQILFPFTLTDPKAQTRRCLGIRGVLNDRMLEVKGNYCNTPNFSLLIYSSISTGPSSSCFLNRCQIPLSRNLKHQLCIENPWGFSVSDSDCDLITEIHNSISDTSPPPTISHVLTSILFLECWSLVSVFWLINVNFIQEKYECNRRNLMTLLPVGL